MTIKLVTPSADASDPKHPEHARWVKDRTLKIEADHARATGLSYADAERSNSRQLERLANRRAYASIPKPPKAKRELNKAELLASGVTRKPAPKRAPLGQAPKCKWCGICHLCKRTRRMVAIMRLAQLGDTRANSLRMELTAISFAEQKNVDYRDHLGREVAFSRMTTQHDRNRGVTAAIEWVCDRSVSFMGEWR